MVASALPLHRMLFLVLAADQHRRRLCSSLHAAQSRIRVLVADAADHVPEWAEVLWRVWLDSPLTCSERVKLLKSQAVTAAGEGARQICVAICLGRVARPRIFL